MSARPIASGTISFGLVSIPVKVYAASNASAAISFNLLHAKDASRLKQHLGAAHPRRAASGEDDPGCALAAAASLRSGVD